MTASMGLDARLRLARLYLCTDARRRQGDLPEFLDAVFAGGVDIVQIREKNLAPDEELKLLALARDVAERYGGLVAVNDSAELAGRFDSDVLHLGQDDGPAASARERLHPWALVGRSTHSERQARQAAEDPAVSYFCVGPVHRTPTKPDYPPVGVDLVRFAARLAPPASMSAAPWFAIGGVNERTLDDVLAAGARRICVVRAITEARDPGAAAASLKARLAAAWRADPAMERYVFAAAASTGPAPWAGRGAGSGE